jgi:signal transduction histidine kinase
VTEVLTGAAILAFTVYFAVSYYYRRFAAGIMKRLNGLLRFNEISRYDPAAFACGLESYLQDMGIEHHAYYFSYLGFEYEKESGVEKKGLCKFRVDTDFTLFVEIIPKSERHELRHANAHILETVFHTLKADILLKVTAINHAFDSLSRVQSLILHDMKNIGQFIRILSYNLEQAANEEEELSIIENLREASPAVLSRVNKVLDAIADTEESASEPEEFSMAGEISACASAYGVKPVIEGDAFIECDKNALRTAVDNILKNFYEKSRNENILMKININVSDLEAVVYFDDNGKEPENYERLFEPFYTTKENGLGVGLYRSRLAVQSLGGSLRAYSSEGNVRFELRLPVNLC